MGAKRRPTYDLDAIKTTFGSVDTLAITTSALRDAVGLGFDRAGVIEVIDSMTRKMFVKSMTTFADHRVWQDVYHVPARDGLPRNRRNVDARSPSIHRTYKGESMIVDLPGYYPPSDGEGVHVGDDMAAVHAALRALKEKIDGGPAPSTIRRIRTKLKLSQREAGSLFKVGENAFDKYERGLIEPSGPTIQLMTLLEKHPELLDELR